MRLAFAVLCAVLVVACIGWPVAIVWAKAGYQHNPVQGATVDERDLEG